MKRLVGLFLYFYIFFVSWANAFALGRWLRVHILLLLLSCLLSCSYYIIYHKPKIGYRKIFCAEDFLLVLFMLGIFVSAVIHPNDKTFNYLFAYSIVFGLGSLYLKIILFDFTKLKNVFNVNSIAIIFVAFYALVEFYMFYAKGVNIQLYIPHFEEGIHGTFTSLFKRSYAFSTEPGNLALYFNTFGPLAVWNLWSKGFLRKSTKIFFTSIVFFGWLCTFSAAGFAFMIASICIVLVLSVKSKIILKLIFYRIIPLLLLFIFLATRIEVVRTTTTFIINPIVNKLVLSSDNGSASVRLTQWKYSLKSIETNPFFGMGIGSFSNIGALSWYLSVAAEAGLVALFPLLLFLFIVFVRIMNSKEKFKRWVAVGYLSSVFHYLVVSTFFDLFLWLLIAIFYVSRVEAIKEKQVNQLLA